MTPSFRDVEATATTDPHNVSVPVCSWTSLLERFDGDRNLIRELAALFREETTTNLPRLEHAAATGDVTGVLRVAHSLRGAVSNFEAPSVVAMLAKMEEAAKTGATVDALSLLPKLKVLLDRLLRELDA